MHSHERLLVLYFFKTDGASVHNVSPDCQQDLHHVHGGASSDDITPRGDQSSTDATPAHVIWQTGKRLHQSDWKWSRRVGTRDSRPALITPSSKQQCIQFTANSSYINYYTHYGNC